MSKTRIGFIGVGGIAQRHLGVLEQFGDVELAGFADPDFDRAVQAAARFGAKAFDSANALLDDANLDAVYICIPPFAHGEAERAVIARGCRFSSKSRCLSISVSPMPWPPKSMRRG